MFPHSCATWNVALLLCLGLAAADVTSGAQATIPRPAPEARTSGGAETRGPDACALLTSADIEEVQGEPVLTTKSGLSDGDVVSVSQCFYILATFSDSISLEVIRSGPAGVTSQGAEDRWRRMFHGDPPGGDLEEAGGQDAPGPQPVEGVGDEAFWVRNGPMGALYVLQREGYLRISVGGREDAPAKIRKTRTLALKALQRLGRAVRS